jgi:hypothetical protein
VTLVIASSAPADWPTLLNETATAGGYIVVAAGTEVAFSLVRESPVASWTRGAWMTPIGAKGKICPGARFLGFL